MTIQLTSAAFEDAGTIPRKYSCDGENVSPPLSWSGIPDGAQSLALIVDDPDAPGRTYVHWVLFNIPPGQDGLPERAQNIGVGGKNNANKTIYSGPCPPPGSTHRYFFKLYALDAQLNLSLGATKADLLQAMEGHILAQGELMGKYKR
jgi:Raf kinase inhibitor-like YbhB/YbcL family protein